MIEIETYHLYFYLVRGYIAFVHKLRETVNYIFLLQSKKKENERLVYFHRYNMVLLSTTAMPQWSCGRLACDPRSRQT